MKATVDAAVTVTIQATIVKVTPGQTPAAKTTPTLTPRPTLEPVNTAAKRAKTITTSLGQQVDVTVQGFDDSWLRFNQLLQAINEGEQILGVPYPSPRVTMNRARTLSGGFCGHNQMSYAPRYVEDPYIVDNSIIKVRVDKDCDKTFASVAHETAHTWFHGNRHANWIDEGLANAIEYQILETNPEDRETYPPTTYCESYRNIRELESHGPGRVSQERPIGFKCNYILGDGIFGELRAYYGDREFNRRIAQLARREENDTNEEYTIADIRRALGGEAPALDIINRWYSGEPEVRKYRHLDAVDWTHTPTMDGEYIHFSGITSQPGLVQDFVLGKDSYCSQFPLYEGRQWVASVADPLPAGWRHSEIPKVVTVNHHIYPTTGEFSVTAKINDKALANMSDLSLSVTSRVTTGVDGKCKESITYSQVPVASGQIPKDFKVGRHYHLDAIQWISPPTISGNTMRFKGKALPGAIQMTWQEGFCGQFFFYESDETGYHYIDNLNPMLPGNRHWTGRITGEVTAQHIGADGTFEALVRLSDNALTGYRNLVLLVKTQAIVDRVANKCGKSDVLSAVDIR